MREKEKRERKKEMDRLILSDVKHLKVNFFFFEVLNYADKKNQMCLNTFANYMILLCFKARFSGRAIVLGSREPEFKFCLGSV